MAYIGREPQIGNFQVCDAISTVNDQAAYTMQVGGVNVSPETANHMLVSLNGILQQPNSSFTVSGSTITFASNLVTGDVINFIQILGSVLDLGVPSDSTVSTVKIVDDAVTLAKMASGTDGNIISYDASGNPVAVATGTDGQVLTSTGAGSPPVFEDAGGGAHTLLSTTTISNVAQVDIEANIDSTYSKYYFKLSKLKCQTDDAYLLSRLKVGSYQTANYEYVNTDTRTNGTTFDNGSQHAESTSYILTQNNNGQGNAADESFDFDIWLSNPADTAIHKFFWGLGQGWRSEHKMCQHRFFGGYHGGTGAITGVRFYMNTGNILSGTIQLYGIV